MDSYGLGMRTACNLHYCSTLDNRFGAMRCAREIYPHDWCGATFNISRVTRRLEPDKYKPDSSTWEGLLATWFGR